MKGYNSREESMLLAGSQFNELKMTFLAFKGTIRQNFFHDNKMAKGNRKAGCERNGGDFL